MGKTENTMLHIGSCRLCETGPLGLLRCGGCQRVVVVCDECDAAWPDANVAAKPTLAIDGPSGTETLPCPGCGASLFDAPSRWATREECLAETWVAESLDRGDLELGEGEPLGGG